MAREFFKNLPDTSTPLNAQRLNSILNGEESMGSIAVEGIKSKNLFDKNDIVKEYYIDSDGSIIWDSNMCYSNAFIEVKSNNVYTLSNDVTTFLGIAEYDENKNFIIRNILNDGISRSFTFSTTSNTKFVRVVTGWRTTDKLQLEEGSIATEYAPHKKYGYNSQESMGNIVVDNIRSKNLFNKNTIFFGWLHVDSNIVMDDFTFTYVTSDYIEVKPNTTYTLNLYDAENLNSGGIMQYDTSKNWLGDGIAETQEIITFTTKSDTKYVRFVLRNAVKDNVQLEEGNVATEHAEHKEFSNKQIYSNNEQVIGEWLGKPLYRRVYTGNLVNNFTENGKILSFIQDNTLQINKLVNGKGFIETNNYQFIPFNGGTVEVRYNGSVNGANTILLTFADETLVGKYYEVAIEYTKTID